MRPFRQHAGDVIRAALPVRAGLVAALAALVAAAPLGAQDTTASASPSASAAPAARADTTGVVAAPDSAPAPASPDSAATTGQTHTVKKGDTLWDLAHAFLGDAFLWPDIYRLNTEIVEDPHWIYPGEVLRIPGGAQMVAANRVEPREPELPVPASPGAPTVFANGPDGSRIVMSRFGGSATQYPHTAVRAGEFYAAPWVDRVGGPRGKGRLIATVDLPGIGGGTSKVRLGPQERAYITLPKDMIAARGDRFLVFAEGARVEDGAQVMVPTGVVEVERADNGGAATTVRLVQQFGEVKVGQGVVPLDRFTLAADARPTPLLLGTESKVIYVPSNEVLPSVQDYVILDATMRDGVKVGDQFTLVRPRQQVDVDDAGRVTLPEEEIALAQVVKVTERGATALIVDQRQPVIRQGTRARLTARMP